jgi:hypothetical protein
VGSHLANTENLRNHLPKLFATYNTRSIFDAPCGDFNWMKHVLEDYPLDYTGADIVAPLIESLNSKYRDERTRFLHLDLTTESFPLADLMLCRDCLFHLSYDDTRSALRNFVESEIPYLLTTTHINSGQIVNRDITTGAWRPIDLFSAPYGFPREVLFRINDSRAEDIEKEMCLWSRDQVRQALTALSSLGSA